MKGFIGAILLLSTFQAYAADPVLLKTGRELYASYENITGISGHDADLLQLFKLNVDRLPKLGKPDELSNSTVLATTELGGAFCKKAVLHEKDIPFGQRVLFGDVDFKRGPEQWDDYLAGVLIDHLALAFWQRTANDSEKKVLFGVLSAAGSDQKGTDATTETVNDMQVLCATYASSLATLTK